MNRCRRDGGGHSPGRVFVFAAGADFLIDQGKEQWDGEAEKQHHEQDRLDDVDDIPGDPAFGERPERADAIAVCIVEENVAEAGEAGIQKKQSPARRKIGSRILRRRRRQIP